MSKSIAFGNLLINLWANYCCIYLELTLQRKGSAMVFDDSEKAEKIDFGKGIFVKSQVNLGLPGWINFQVLIWRTIYQRGNIFQKIIKNCIGTENRQLFNEHILGKNYVLFMFFNIKSLCGGVTGYSVK